MDAASLDLGPGPARGLAVLVLALGGIATLSWLLYRRLGSVPPRSETMSFWEHLEEFRVRLLRSGILVLAWTTLFLAVRVESFTVGGVRVGYPVPSLYDNVAAQVYLWIASVTVPPGVQIIVASPTEAVAAQMEVALFLGLLVALPLVLYEVWAFFAPGLRSTELRFLRGTFPAGLVLFLLGSAFGFLVVVPLLFAVLYGFAGPLGALTFLSAGNLVGTVVTTSLLFGVAFELPLAMVGLVRIGLVDPRTYLRKWRHATLAIFIVAALASDPTLTSQLIIGSILLLLYWSGVAGSFLVASSRRHAVRTAPA